ncbi:hypothetical protein C7D71_30760, partial [Klebsiella pneumoniae]
MAIIIEFVLILTGIRQVYSVPCDKAPHHLKNSDIKSIGDAIRNQVLGKKNGNNNRIRFDIDGDTSGLQRALRQGTSSLEEFG